MELDLGKIVASLISYAHNSCVAVSNPCKNAKGAMNTHERQQLSINAFSLQCSSILLLNQHISCPIYTDTAQIVCTSISLLEGF
jgi:hypothetical protein